ncbi:hypothetical protein DITRI_Ditri03aG0110400 [Diplodiscus trichospermus]
MAEKEAPAASTETNPPTENIETLAHDGDDTEGFNRGDSNSKRGREEDGEESDEASKKQKVEKTLEEENLEKKPVSSESGPVRLGPKEFGSSVEMFDYFYNLLHHWPAQLDLNKYEHMVLLDLLKKGHPEPDKKIGGGIKAFQIRNHPMWKSKCFFVIRDDETVEDFSFRKCVDHILPLPEDMKIKPDANRALGSGGGKGRGRGGGRGGKSRN